MIPENFLKYPTPSSFLCKYDKFSGSNKYNDVELNTLRDVANWMDVLLHIINAKKNKGLILSIVTKCVEGWNASYITGSGQTEATADRVHIYETEGQVKPLKRSKNILMKPPSPYGAYTTTKK